MSDAESDDIGNDDELGAFEPGFQDDDNIKNDQRELFLADSPDVKAESQASRSSSRKRSHAEMDVVVKERDSSATMQQSSDQSEAIIHAAARANRDNVNVQDKTGPLSESQTSASGQDSSVDSRAMPPPPPRLKDAQPDESVSIGEPDDELEAFHWDGLTERYHAKIREFDKIDEEIMREFEQLCNRFSVWAYAGSTRETERTFKRLKTQMAYVQHHESELEKKRQHYVKVVDAFKSALQLLNG